MRQCAACGKTDHLVGLGSTLVCRECEPDIRAEMERLRTEGKTVSVPRIAREIFRAEHSAGNYLLRDIPDDLWRQVKSRAALEGISARELILDALRKRISNKEAAMDPIKVNIYPAHMTQETTSHKYLHDAAVRFANELTGKIREAYPDAELDIDIKPAGDSGPDGGAHCDNQNVQEHVEHLYDQTFDQGSFWPEVTGYCIYCDRPVYTETAPAYGDDDTWADIALEHADDCEWVLTRAHQLEE